MKRNTPQHPKIDRLIDELDIPRYAAVGLLESLWHVCAANTPRGDIGSYENKSIARRLEWGGDPDALVAGLAAAGWLDEHPEHRLIVHDWPDHCEDAVHMRLARATEYFADGARPRMGRIAQSERATIVTSYETKGLESVHTDNARDTHAVSTAPALAPAHASALAPALAPAPPIPEQGHGMRTANAHGAGGSGGGESQSGGGGGSGGSVAEAVERLAKARGVNAHAGQIADLLRAAGVQSDAKVEQIAKRTDLTPDLVQRTIRAVASDGSAEDPARVIAYRLTTKKAADLEADLAGGKRAAVTARAG